MRASIHIKLPKLQKNRQKFETIANEYNFEIRAIKAEDSNDYTFDIQNKKRLGKTEAQLVQDMIDGVRKLIEAEKTEPEQVEAPAEE